MQKYSDVIQDRNGNAIGACTVTVTDYPGGSSSTTYATDAIGANTNPITADSNGEFSFYAKDGSYTLTVTKSGISQATKVITLKDNDDVVSVFGYGAAGDGTTDDTAAIQAAINTTKNVLFPGGYTYKASGLTQSTNGQILYSNGVATIQKNANGVILTCSGNDVQLRNLAFRGESSTPTFTGDNVNASGNNFSMINCSSQWAYAYAVKATGSHTVIEGTAGGVYQTTDASGSGYDIFLGVSGTATLYHKIDKIYTSQSTGGIRLIDTGGTSVSNSTFGKISIESGTSPAGVGGGMWNNNRILGNCTISLSSSAWSSNQFSDVTVTFSGGTSGHALDGSNVFSGSAVITDSSNASYVVDVRETTPITYTPSWTAASVNPSIGNGTITGRYVKIGRVVHASVRIGMGSTTTYGTGAWFISLPYAPTTSVPWQGSATILDSGTALYLGAPRGMLDGTARMQLWANGTSAVCDATRPFTWANGDDLNISITYTT